MYILRQPEQFRDTLKLVDKDGREQMVEISLKITPDMIKSSSMRSLYSALLLTRLCILRGSPTISPEFILGSNELYGS